METNIVEKSTLLYCLSIVSGDIMSQKYHLYCEYLLIKHKPFIGEVHNSWGGHITDPEENYDNENCSLVE